MLLDLEASQSLFEHASSCAGPAAAPTGADYYTRNQYHVHGGYSKPSGPSYDNSGYNTGSYNSTQVPTSLDIFRTARAADASHSPLYTDAHGS